MSAAFARLTPRMLCGLLAVVAGLPFWCEAGELDDGGSVPQSVAVLDANRDGVFDLAVAYAFSEEVRVFLSQDTGTRVLSDSHVVGLNPTPGADLPRHLLARDLNRDGLDDLVVLCSGNPLLGTRASLQILEGLPGGFFAPRAPRPAEPNSGTPRFPTAMAIEDLDGDGEADIAVANQEFPAVSLFESVGTGYLAFRGDVHFPGLSGISDVSIRDIDGDSHPDLVVIGEGGGVDVAGRSSNLREHVPNGLFVSRGGTGLQFQTPQLVAALDTRPLSLAVGDVDSNGSSDAVIGDDSGHVLVLHDIVSSLAGATQAFKAATIPGAVFTDVELLDWTLDGFLDIAAVDNGGNALRIVSPSGGAEAPLLTGLQPRRSAVADLDGDGSPDLVTANEGDESDASNEDITVLLNPNEPEEDGTDRPSLSLLSTIPLRSLYPGGPETITAATWQPGVGYWLIDGRERRIHRVGIDGTGAPVSSVETAPELEAPDISGIAYVGDGESDPTTDPPSSFTYLLWRSGALSGSTDADAGAIPLDSPVRGLSGLAYHVPSQEFWIGNPGDRRIIQTDEFGHVLSQYETDLPYGSLAIDSSEALLYAAPNGGRRVGVYSIASSSFTKIGSIELAGLSPFLQDASVAALAVNETGDELAVFTTDLSLVRISLTAIPGLGTPGLAGPIVTLTRGRRVTSLAFDSSRGILLALDATSVPAVLMITPDGQRLGEMAIPVPLAGELNGRRFRPSSLGYDSLRDEIVLVDRMQPRFLLLSPTGVPIGVFAWTNLSNSDVRPPITGIHVGDGGVYILRTGSGLVRARRSGEAVVQVPLNSDDPADIAAASAPLFLLSPLQRRVDSVAESGVLNSFELLSGLIPPARELSGLAADGATRTLFVASRDSDEIFLFELPATGPDSAVGDWLRY